MLSNIRGVVKEYWSVKYCANYVQSASDIIVMSSQLKSHLVLKNELPTKYIARIFMFSKLTK